MNHGPVDDELRRLVHSAIGSWRDNLVNLTGANRLLSFRPRKTSAVTIIGPEPAKIVGMLAAGVRFAFRGPAVELSKDAEPTPVLRGRGRDVLHTEVGGSDLGNALRNLYRRSHQEYLDRGLRVLYLAVGLLEWTDATGMGFSSPLLLIPVELVHNGPRQLPDLVATDDDPVLNPALTLRLADLDLQLPALPDVGELNSAAVLERVRATVGGRRGWRVVDAAVVSYFTFAKEAMYRDLLDNEARIASHPAVVALAAGGRGLDVGDFGFDEIPDQDIDTVAPVDRTPLVLDADSSQRACIAAAVEGRSFVMDGPPGTGKSQTIANMIGALLGAGRTVLFVSEKAAALDVVRNRLTEVGLGAYLLELHSNKATRKEIAAELGRALTHRPRSAPGMGGTDTERLRDRQDELNRYAAAMNEPRYPLDLSLHAVIGRLAQLSESPVAPLTGLSFETLSAASFAQIRQHAKGLAGAWRPALQGASYVWRDVRTPHPLTARLLAALRALDDLEELMVANKPAADAFHMAGIASAADLAMVLEQWTARPPHVPENWLTTLSVEEIEGAVDALDAQVGAIRQRQRDVVDACGTAWTDLPSADGLDALDLRRIAYLEPPPLSVDQLDGRAANDLLTRLRSDSALLRDCQAALDDVAGVLGLPIPRTFDEADRLLFVAATAEQPDRPVAAWLSHRGRSTARAAIKHLATAKHMLDEAERAAARFFDESALAVDAARLEERFRTLHTGLRRLGGQYRKDKAEVAGFTKDGITPADAHRNLGLVVAWQHAAAAFTAAMPSYARDLGPYFQGRATDPDQVGRALDVAAGIAERYPDDDLRGVAEQVTVGARTAPLLGHAAHAASDALHRWRLALSDVVEIGPRPALLRGTVRDAAVWLDEHVVVLTMAIGVLSGIDRATASSRTVADARRLLRLRKAVDDAIGALDSSSSRHRTIFGSHYAGAETDVTGLRSAASWVKDLRGLTGAPLTAEQARVLRFDTDPGPLRKAADAWRVHRADVVDAFSASRHAELQDDLSDDVGARDTLSALLDDTAGQAEWTVYQENRSALARSGLESVVDFCIRAQLIADNVPAVVEKAVLTEWADGQIAADRALRLVRAQDRDAVVAEFRELDRAIVETAVNRVIDTCNSRRPRSLVGGQAAVIKRESEKKARHMPVRELVLRSRDVAQAIKPCFMMSPLAVSQYLPSDLEFDVVIFDEASQVAPMDAINCIYRGRALITAGDAKQLPPTSFFALAGDDADEWTEESDDAQDFESILDLAKSSGSFRSLTLRWHYRSRHEALIAFSNSSFYKGELITFPGAEHEGSDVGVQLVPVKGVYRRGSSRTNPIEARKVAELVLRHYDTRPGKSVGVVTFSEAQAAAIEAAVEEVRRDRPDLDEQFAENRLDGFFVKSLESVQGDERDVMIFSIGYGPDEHGKTTMAFGPLNREGGWRRLNVAITRARYRNEIVSSISAGDITASSNEGVRHLRRYLDFAERGLPALALDTAAGGDAESPFEESVIATIRSWGYDVTPQVGAAGYRIDMAVHHPDHPGVYVLGVECDGAQYHSSRVARDRDRLRDQVLVGLGWTMHRIWGTAWYRDRPGAERRLIEAIERAIQAPVRGLLGGAASPVRPLRDDVVLEEIAFDETPDWTAPYAVARIHGRPTWAEPHEPAVVPVLQHVIEQIVAAEAPVHMDVVRQRLRERWHIGQIGARIRGNLDAAVRIADVVREGEFLHRRSDRQVTVRTPVDECRRTVEQVHDEELETALLCMVRDTGGIGGDDLTAQVARLYGWSRRGPDIMRRLGGLIDRLVAGGRLARSGDELRAEA